MKHNGKELTPEQVLKLRALVKKMAFGMLWTNMFYMLLLILASIATGFLGALVVHSTVFCVVAGFFNFICYAKMIENSSKQYKAEYIKKAKEVLGE